MKKLILGAFLLGATFASAQTLKLGVKSGFNFGYGGKISGVTTDINKDNVTGWHLGLFSRVGLGGVYLQPELYYSHFKSEYTVEGGSFDVKSNRLDMPVLLGKKVLGVGRINAGPVFSYNFEDKFSLGEVKDIKADKVSLAGQVGIGVDLANVTIDARYEFGLGKNSTKFINGVSGEQFEMRKRPSTLLLSVGYAF